LNADQCANAAANARAKFASKAPRFPSREACERNFAAAGCGSGFKGAEGWAGKKSAIYFSPRQAGFRVLVSSPGDAGDTPFALDPLIRFSPRSIMRKDTRIGPKIAYNARVSLLAQPGRREHLAWTCPPSKLRLSPMAVGKGERLAILCDMALQAFGAKVCKRLDRRSDA